MIRLRRQAVQGDTLPGEPVSDLRQIVRSGLFTPVAMITEAIARVSLIAGKTVTSFCDLATCDEAGLVSFRGDYATVITIAGMRRNARPSAIARTADALRVALSAAFNQPGHALQFFYASDPDGALETIQASIANSRTIASSLQLDFEDIFAERLRRLPQSMRQERMGVVIWTREGKLNRQEKIAANRARKEALHGLPPLGDAQNPFLGSKELGTIHAAFVQHVLGELGRNGIDAHAHTPKDALRLIRTAIYPEARGSVWEPVTPSDRPPGAIPDRDMPADLSDVLWPPLREQLFMADATVDGFSTARLGTADWTPIEVTVAPEKVRPFGELVGILKDRPLPWQFSALIEGTRPGYMEWKKTLALGLRFGINSSIYAGFEQVKAVRDSRADNVVKLRMGFATRSPMGEARDLMMGASQLQQAVGAWGGAQASRVCGDPLAGVLATMPGLAVAATAPAAAAPLSEVLAMMPWARPAPPWASGPMLSRTEDGIAIPLDPSGTGREVMLDIFVAASRRGKSMLSNALLLSTILSHAAMTNHGVKLPLIGKLDIGSASAGLVDVIRNALPVEQRHLALHVPFQMIEEHAVNIFDTEACCRHPLEYHRTFLENFLNRMCTPLGGDPFEPMHQLISRAIDEVYEMYSDLPTATRTKPYRAAPGSEIDRALDRHGIVPVPRASWWWIADAFAAADDMRMAGFATRRAVPTLTDLLDTLNVDHIREHLARTPSSDTRESIGSVFRRYVEDFIHKNPTLNMPTRLDLGEARVIVLDIDRVAPEGEGQARFKTELMYLLGLHIVSRNFFLRAEDAGHVPEHVRERHRKRFQEFEESFKRLECDEFQRAGQARIVQQQFEEVARRGAKRNFTIGLASQRLSDFGDYLAGHSTGRFFLGVDNDRETEEIIQQFGLTDASADIARNGLRGPYADGRGAPFLMQVMVRNEKYELYLLNTLGPIELWALSTTAQDMALRQRLYDKLGSKEARRRLAIVFPKGTAVAELEHRREARVRMGESAERGLASAADELADELFNGTGLGTKIRQGDPTTTHEGR